MATARLPAIPPLAGRPDVVLSALAVGGAGEALAAEGDFGHAVYVIESGTADVIGDVAIRSIGPGDVVGEIAVLEAGRARHWRPKVTSVTPCT